MAKNAPKTKKRSYKRKSMSKSTNPSKRFAKMVKKVVHKEQENKIAFSTTGDNLISFNSGIGDGIDPGGDCRFILPDISKGSDENDRIGAEIKAQKLKIRGYLNLGIVTTDNSASNRRIGVRLMVVTPKRFPNGTDAYNNAQSWLSQLIKKGGTSTYFTGKPQDLFAPINSDCVTKHYDRVIYMSQDYIKSWVQTTNVGSQLAMDVRNTIKFFNINIKLRNKKLLYDDGVSGGVAPTNQCYVLLVGYAHLDNSAVDTATTAVSLCYDSHFEYEDA